jgi:hypothetical protein
MPLPENHCSTLFTTQCKRLTEGGCKVFALRLLLLAFGFLVWEAFGREDCWRKIVEWGK